jgi:hypothetical protein
MYKSTDGGDHWSGPIGSQYFSGRGIGSIEVKPGETSTIFVATGAHGSRGLSSTCCTGVDRGARSWALRTSGSGGRRTAARPSRWSEPRGEAAASADADIHPSVAIRQRDHVELGPLDARTGGRVDRGRERREDLRPRARVAVGARAPEPLA